MAYLPGYSKYADLVVNGALMPGGGLSAAASGWQTVAIPADLLAVCQADLRDLRITTDDGTTLVDYAIESVTSGIVWVRPAAWSSGLTTVRAYGGHLTATDAQNWPAVTAGWAGVWPLNDVGPTAADKTGNGNNGTVTGATFTGDGIAGANRLYNDVTNFDFCEVPHSASLAITGDFTLLADVFLAGTRDNNYYQTILEKRQWGTDVPVTYSIGTMINSYNIDFYNGAVYNSGHAVPFVDWTHVTVTLLGSQLTFYSNGTAVSTAVAAIGPPNTSPVYIGGMRNGGGGNQTLYGTIRNVAISPFAASADQVKLLAIAPGHASQSWGAVQDVPAAGLPMYLFQRGIYRPAYSRVTRF